MPDDPRDERSVLIREVRQRLESLRRAGIDWFPTPLAAAPVSRRTAQHVVVAAAEPETPAAVAATPAPTITTAPSPPPASKQAPASSLFDAADFDTPLVPPDERLAQLAALAQEVAACERCPILASTRTQTVFGSGPPTARLMFVGEAPGADEDRLGLPFVGRAGMLLTDMITKGMGLRRDEVYIANVLKSRPPENRTPEASEVAHCLPFLERQIAIIRPQFLCLLGRVAATALLDTMLPLGRLRGRWHRYRGIPTIVTYHPSYLLRSPEEKKKAWEDLQLLMQAMGLKPPPRKKS
ncbi:MAG: uracil-DNA glycosylase [Isosphaeraceae bacterium]|nr:uracil-DNA glycosylase [Isosphaeraceae bacterium]